MKKILVVWILLVFAIPAHAQEDAPCDVAALTANYAETLTAVTDLEGLEAVSAQMRMDIATCNGLSIVSKGADVLGPLELDGVYLVEFGYNDVIPSYPYLLFDVQPLGEYEVLDISAQLSEEVPTGKATIEFDGGSYIISMDGITEQWFVTLTKIN